MQSEKKTGVMGNSRTKSILSQRILHMKLGQHRLLLMGISTTKSNQSQRISHMKLKNGLTKTGPYPLQITPLVSVGKAGSSCQSDECHAAKSCPGLSKSWIPRRRTR